MKYGITSFSLTIKVMSTLITFTVTYAKQIAVLSTAIAVCTALWYKETIAIKIKSAAVQYASAVDKAYAATSTLLRAALVALQAHGLISQKAYRATSW